MENVCKTIRELDTKKIKSLTDNLGSAQKLTRFNRINKDVFSLFFQL